MDKVEVLGLSMMAAMIELQNPFGDFMRKFAKRQHRYASPTLKNFTNTQICIN
jgi:hypothetical protein